MRSHHLDITHSLWRKTAPNRAPCPPLSGTSSADIVIIGGGFTGLNAALQSALKGYDVALLEAHEVGWGASGRNGGQVNPALPIATPEALFSAFKAPFAERFAHLSLNSADYLFDLIKTHQIDCDARQTGWIRAHHNEAAKNKAISSAQKWGEYGAQMSLLGSSETSALTGTHRYDSALLTQAGGLVHPLKLARGLADTAIRNGARLYENSPLHALKKLAQGWQIITDKGAITARLIIFATNAYAGLNARKSAPEQRPLTRAIIPVCPIQIATDPLDDALADSILPYGHSISDSRRMIIYARREPCNRIIYGSIGKRGIDGRLAGFAWLRRDALKTFPQLRGVDWPYQWGGQIALTDNKLPRLATVADGIIAGFGYNGRGVAMAHVMGQILADYATGTAEADLPLPLMPPKPYSGRFIQTMGLNSYIEFAKICDWLESM